MAKRAGNKRAAPRRWRVFLCMMTLVILYMVTALTMMWRRMGQHKAGRRRETRQLAANTSQAMLLHAVAREAKLKQVKLSAARARSLDPIGSTGQHGVSAYRNRSAEAEAMLEAAKDQGLDRFLQQKACGATGLHVFYYAWYANRDNDDHWSHWNHKVLPHWTAAVNERFKDRIGQEHAPPLDIGSNFFPSLGAYSSKDPAVVELHVEMMAKSGMGVLVYSWWGRGKADANGDPTDERLIELVMNKCEERRVKFAFHLEPYEGRTARSVGEDVAYILRRFGSHPALYRNPSRGNRVMIYLYDSYRIPAKEWAQVFTSSGSFTVRGTSNDCVVLGLWVEPAHGEEVKSSGFDGFYTYFATDGFSFASTRTNWNSLQQFATKNNLLFVPSIGPGYVDTSIRPWNEQNTRPRNEGAYFERAWRDAEALEPPIISLTSFNEWHEGTQLEPATQKAGYLDYGQAGSAGYLAMVRRHVDRCQTFLRSIDNQSRKGPLWCSPAAV